MTSRRLPPDWSCDLSPLEIVKRRRQERRSPEELPPIDDKTRAALREANDANWERYWEELSNEEKRASIEFQNRLDEEACQACLFEFQLHLAYFREEGLFDDDEVGFNLRRYAEACDRLGIPVELPAEFARLVAKRLSGQLQKRPGPRLSFSELMDIDIVQGEFHRRRLAGESYDSVVNDIATTLSVSRKTVESWMSRKSLLNSGKQIG